LLGFIINLFFHYNVYIIFNEWEKMLKSLTTLGFLLVFCATYSQDLIYTVSGHFDGENQALDSILFENLSNESRVLFDNLPVQYNYLVHLTNQEIIHLQEFDNSIADVGFVLLKHSPGLLSLESTMSINEDVHFLICDISGRILHSTIMNEIVAGSIFNVEIPFEGIYVLKRL